VLGATPLPERTQLQMVRTMHQATEGEQYQEDVPEQAADAAPGGAPFVAGTQPAGPSAPVLGPGHALQAAPGLALYSRDEVNIMIQEAVRAAMSAVTVAPQRMDATRASAEPVMSRPAPLSLPAYVKLLPLPAVFDGDRTNVGRFECAVERYARAAGMADPAIMEWVPFLLSGEAENWYNILGDEGNLPISWPLFKQALRERFEDPAAAKRARERLDSLTLTTSVAALRSEFESTLTRIPTLSTGEQVHIFVSKLSGRIRVHVEMSQPETLADAFRVAEMAELAEAAADGDDSSSQEEEGDDAARTARTQPGPYVYIPPSRWTGPRWSQPTRCKSNDGG